MCSEQGEGVGDGFGAVEVGLDAHDVAVDGFVEGFEVAGGFEEFEGAGWVVGDGDAGEGGEGVEVAAAGGFAQGDEPFAGVIDAEGAAVGGDGGFAGVGAGVGVGVAEVGGGDEEGPVVDAD